MNRAYENLTLLTLDIVQLCPFLFELRLQRLRLGLEIAEGLGGLNLLCRHFRDDRGSHVSVFYEQRWAAERWTWLPADVAVVTSHGKRRSSSF